MTAGFRMNRSDDGSWVMLQLRARHAPLAFVELQSDASVVSPMSLRFWSILEGLQLTNAMGGH